MVAVQLEYRSVSTSFAVPDELEPVTRHPKVTPPGEDMRYHHALCYGCGADAVNGLHVRVIAGEVDGHAGPGATHTPITLAHATIEPGAQLNLPWNRQFNALVYVLSGRGSVGPVGHPIRQGQLAVLGPGDRITVAADGGQDSNRPALEVLLLGGKPIREPVFQYGPFVMNSKAEVIEAMEDFNAGRFGSIPANALRPHRVQG